MSYSDLTFHDPNPVKRFLQKSRLTAAVRLAHGAAPGAILDFGSGDGELCKHLRAAFPRSRVLCYEPAPQLLTQAQHNLQGSTGIQLLSRLDTVAAAGVDLVFALEVFEHLPPRETSEALDRIAGLLSAEGRVIIGLPVEIGVPALYKGLFRIARRRGEFDASLANIVACTVGRPPRARPLVQLDADLAYHPHHVGFDHRRFATVLSESFDVEAAVATPWPLLGPALNPEIYYVARRRDRPALRHAA